MRVYVHTCIYIYIYVYIIQIVYTSNIIHVRVYRYILYHSLYVLCCVLADASGENAAGDKTEGEELYHNLVRNHSYIYMYVCFIRTATV